MLFMLVDSSKCHDGFIIQSCLSISDMMYILRTFNPSESRDKTWLTPTGTLNDKSVDHASGIAKWDMYAATGKIYEQFQNNGKDAEWDSNENL